MNRARVFGLAMVFAVVFAAGVWLTLRAQGATPASPQAGAAAPAPPPALPPDAPKPPYKRITGPETLNPGDWPQHWPYPDEYDSAVAASEVHHIRYIDGHVRFVEVAYFPGVHGQMHGHPWPSVFAVDAPAPKAYNLNLDPERPPLIGRGPAPQGLQFPTCQSMGPQSPHAETNQDTWPHHFYRLEFLRVDGKSIQDHWKEWYPSLLAAGHDGNKLLYEDSHVRLLEVTVGPNETENIGSTYPSVLAMDAISGSASNDPSTSLIAQGGGQGPAPKGFEAPMCATSGPQASHPVHNASAAPIHFYRIEFRRIDGDGLKDHWREWYPWMAKITDEYHAHPYVSNYY